MHPTRLILASQSPRRRELLTQAGFTFDILPADIDETRLPNEDPATYVQRLALEKARTLQTRHPHATILGADTTVVLNGTVLNKPTDIADAERMLRALSGNTHQVHTGVAVVSPTKQLQHLETTSVFLTPIPEADLAHYLATGDSLDKAGAYGIQGYASRWVRRIEGDYFNVMGLPIATTVALLNQVVEKTSTTPPAR
ncbi:septum formation inhibitor Maf [Granulicella sp. 5B5]|uniref:Maf family protein n=1 Tax=Granulicella sp. 5B5 TaxID=1617967 RepID=UPI0015F41296|nr:Maf family protein [Granulicella sp. 5B5]QMV18820.1 septum formation inhibitor Maf [Granulicella sp. 5B5]